MIFNPLLSEYLQWETVSKDIELRHVICKQKCKQL